MIKKIAFLFILILAFSSQSIAQEHEQRFSEINILHYRFQLELNDTSDVIFGKAKVDIEFLKPISTFQLDLVAKNSKEEKGMEVKNIWMDEKAISFNHQEEKLIIQLDEPTSKGEVKSMVIQYHGIPADGLVIAKNKYGDRTFFGDNWPNRAHHWLPTVDHPSDKATVEFIVTAPDHYQVIANGEQIEETNLDDNTTLTHWKENVPLPTKVMVIGAARFAVNFAGFVNQIPVTSWVYRQDRDNGFGDYKIALGVLDFFVKKMGSYPYEKLANVQSKTRYGGMENAGNIFYYENSVNGEKDQEKLIAHEIAHQWFGNSASEMNWHHVWLSEGFATYLTDLYLEEIRGRDAFLENIQEERNRVIQFSHQKPMPIVNTSIKDYNQLLNPNSYQKGAWVLHMLRQEVGKENFWKGIRMYYQKYKLSNAMSKDFQKVMEQVSGKNLNQFFQQWLYQPGHPVLKVDWKKSSRKKVEINIQQVQNYVFHFPIEIEILNDSGKKYRRTFSISSKNQSFKMKVKGEVTAIKLDPNCRLLFEKAAQK